MMNTPPIPIVAVEYTKPIPESTANETSSALINSRDSLIIQFLSIYALILIIVGTVGNLLTVVVLLRRNLRRLVTIRYLIVVSICDTISLYGWNLNSFYKFNINRNNGNLEEISIIHCRVISFMTFVSLQLSSWCLTAVSFDRALNLYWFHWRQSFGNLKYTKFYIIILTLVCIGLNSHILFLNGYQTSTGSIKCYSTRDNPGYIYPQWERVHLVVYNLCPFAIMCICNTYIIVVTVRSSRAQIESTPPMVQRKTIERYRQLTALLIIVTFAFVLLTLPACIYFVFFRHNLEAKTERTHRYMIQISLNSVQFTSHAINFFLYCFSGKSFLNELRDMFNEIILYCQGNDEEWAINDVRPPNIEQYQESTLENHRTDPEREMHVKNYKFDFFPEFQSGTEHQSTWN
ncbi:unnamed protein product [Adineta ricciae]|uniref:G-protein coupled receptors family 1 profile domain-containing protein n=1 Tax=Adineta ricciae TaxID=249248 RepID=A0A813Z7M8_ADIRI|nr:unnamed protein product [Adineta ricciae]CAF1533846.1 unnamed protein product [Adineta ricciae]